MKKRFMMLALSSVLVLGNLIGCSSGESTKPSETSRNSNEVNTVQDTSGAAGSDKKVTIEFFHQKYENVDFYNKIIPQFMEENPNIQVNVTMGETTTTTFVSRVAAGNVPEFIGLFPMSQTYVQMAHQGIFKDLSDLGYEKKVNESIFNQCKVDDTTYFIPFNTNAYGVWYNVDLFEENNWEIPKTYDEMWELCENLKQQGIQAFTFPDKNGTRIAQSFDRMLVGCVNHDFGSLCDGIKDGTYDLTQDQAFVDYAESIYKLREYANPDSLGYGDEASYDEFINGKSAMMIEGTWALPTFLSMKPDCNIKLAPLPTMTEKEFFTAGTVDTGYAISADVTDEEFEACKKLMEFMLRDDIAQAFVDWDKNPTALNNVTYNVDQLMDINALITENRYLPCLSTIWTQDLRNAINEEVQALLLDKDVNVFVNRVQELIKEYYNK
ncbi:hypothetical protein C0033_20960 [Clostridium sp. chh4-2]|uniref:ABC transporter substrate-binding protein n=1 Tax=Clostridium sp. chh4-2 TaxID=2067550 RepID=UPI000CCF4B01|nr:extracellular solute-binding protein [Clostridium sp. chh4-2]PNV60129.1 hypothetical protein C0033_20960 [Clostridium sp. chh4-2]